MLLPNRCFKNTQSCMYFVYNIFHLKNHYSLLTFGRSYISPEDIRDLMILLNKLLKFHTRFARFDLAQHKANIWEVLNIKSVSEGQP